MPSPVVPTAPVPKNSAADLNRWNHTRLRRRLLYGVWDDDLKGRVRKQIGHVRESAWGNIDLSANAFRSICTQLAVLYDRTPAVPHDDQTEADKLVALVDEAGYWSSQPRTQRDTIGLREMAVRATAVVVDGKAELRYRPAYPDLILAEATHDRPDVPVLYREAVLRRREPGPKSRNGELLWTYDVFDIRKPNAPVHRIEHAENGSDMSAEFLVDAEGRPSPANGLTGERYTERWANGTPFIPAILFHAARTGALWDPYEGRELVEGTLNAGVFWTFFGHCVRAASWPQRYLINGRIRGAELEEVAEDDEVRSAPRPGVTTDPATVVEIEQEEGAIGQPIAGQWGPGADPDVLVTAIGAYDRRNASAYVPAADFHRLEGDPRSGYALAISREGQREAQRRYEPHFARGDLEVLEKSAALANRATGSKLPESGYRMSYKALPPTAEERQAERDHIRELVELGLLDVVSAYQNLHPGTSDADAKRALDQIRKLNAEYRIA